MPREKPSVSSFLSWWRSRQAASVGGTYLTSATLAKVLALDPVPVLSSHLCEFLRRLFVEDPPRQFLHFCLSPFARLEDLEQVPVRHVVVGFVSVQVDADEFSGKRKGDADQSSRLVRTARGQDGETVACGVGRHAVSADRHGAPV